MAHKHLSLHDHFFRSAMAEPKVIKEFFQEYLPPEIKKITDWQLLPLENNLRNLLVASAVNLSAGNTQPHMWQMCCDNMLI